MQALLSKLTLKNMLGALWLFVIGCAVYYYVTVGISLEELRSSLQNLGIWSGVVFVIAYTIRPLIFFPASIMTPLSAVLFGPFVGWIYAFIGSNFSATVAFFAARYFGRSFIKDNQNAFIQKYDEKLRTAGFETVLTLRLIPLFPFDFVNYASGLSGISYARYITATLIGVIPGLTAYIFLGGSLTNPYLLVPTIVLFALLTFVARRYQKKSASHPV